MLVNKSQPRVVWHVRECRPLFWWATCGTSLPLLFVCNVFLIKSSTKKIHRGVNTTIKFTKYVTVLLYLEIWWWRIYVILHSIWSLLDLKKSRRWSILIEEKWTGVGSVWKVIQENLWHVLLHSLMCHWDLMETRVVKLWPCKTAVVESLPDHDGLCSSLLVNCVSCALPLLPAVNPCPYCRDLLVRKGTKLHLRTLLVMYIYNLKKCYKDCEHCTVSHINSRHC